MIPQLQHELSSKSFQLVEVKACLEASQKQVKEAEEAIDEEKLKVQEFESQVAAVELFRERLAKESEKVSSLSLSLSLSLSPSILL